VRRRIGQVVTLAVLAGIVALLAVGVSRREEPMLFARNPVGVMGTDCTLEAVAPAGGATVARQALAAAEAELRRVEAAMSVKIEGTEVSHLNAAPAGEHVALSPGTLEVLAAAREARQTTRGAFDVTCRPLIELWKQAGRDGRLPTPDQIAQARAASSWDAIALEPSAAVKSLDTAGVDLGGIAKGYAIDRAVEAMSAAGIRGGLVEVGGDLRCFGARPDGQAWRVAVRDPFHVQDPDPCQKPLATLQIQDAAVCTSGNYFRFVEIEGRRFSHIIDPRPGKTMGMPAEAAPSVTVVAPTAMTADIWATALSVLGAEGLSLLPADAHIEAMVVEGTPEDYRVRMTPGFADLLVDHAARIQPGEPASQAWSSATRGSEDR
jgi:thiamine biosynthesis lipoprotein